MTLTCTGLVIDINDGSLTLALLAHFSDPAYLDRVRATATGSWESEGATREGPAVEFHELDDPRLNQLTTRMKPSSVFSLDLARQRLGACPPTGRIPGVT